MTRSDLLCAFDGGDDCWPLMMVSEQSHLNVRPPMHGKFLNAKSPIRLLYQTGKLAKLTFVQVYAPTEDASDAEKDSFYDDLLLEINRIPRSTPRSARHHMISPHGLVTETNDSGMRLFVLHKDSCSGTHTFHTSGSTKLRGKPRVPVGCTTKSAMFASLSVGARLTSTCKVRGADVGTDYFLLVATCGLRLRWLPACGQRPKPFDVVQLRDPVELQQYNDEVRNHFELLAPPHDLDSRWEQFRDTLVTVADVAIGRRRGTFRERWIRPRSRALIDERHHAKQVQDQARINTDRQAAEMNIKTRIDKWSEVADANPRRALDSRKS